MSTRVESTEGLYADYRKTLLEKELLPILKLGECLIIEGTSGTGKSKFLRHISSSEVLDDKYFSPKGIKLIYIDLNRAYEHDVGSILKVIANSIEANGHMVEDVEAKIEKQLKEREKLYLILDHAEQLNHFPETTIRLLRSLRDQHKYKLAYLFTVEQEKNIDPNKLKYLYNVTKFVVEIGPLTKEEAKINITQYAKTNNIDLEKSEIDQIAQASNFYPKNIGSILRHIELGNSVNDAINKHIQNESLKSSNNGKTEITTPTPTSIIEKNQNTQLMSTETSESTNKTENDTDILQTALRNMTKSEYLIFIAVYNAKGDIVTRDYLATLLNPDNEGDGVSNESIDQLMSRVRKAIKKIDLPVKIKTKHGVGYYLESN